MAYEGELTPATAGVVDLAMGMSALKGRQNTVRGKRSATPERRGKRSATPGRRGKRSATPGRRRIAQRAIAAAGGVSAEPIAGVKAPY